MLAVRLLGPLAVEVDGERILLSSVMKKAILAQLALAGGRIVPVDALVAGLWGEAPPASAANAIQVHVSGLRKALGGAGGLIRTSPPGYHLDGADVDVIRFERLVDEARKGRAAAWRDALDQWTGDAALADLLEVPFAPAAATRLDDLRLTATEEFIESELACGQASTYVSVLTELTDRHPYRETFWRLLMLALYRVGRQGDALATFRTAAKLLSYDIGIDPGPALTAMHGAILAQDPALNGPAAHDDLPPLTGELIGRAAELDNVLARVRTSRLVSLVGPGGVGKTRIALEVAHHLHAEFVTFADVTTAEAAMPRIAAGGRTPLVLDNLEQIADADVLVRQLLDNTQRAILATSRSPLHLHAEKVVNIAPLALPYAHELFVAEARRAGTDDTLDGPTVTAICQRLDRLPLALVLAAARCRSMTPAQVMRRLAGDGLGDGPKDLPGRHRTLLATVRWSVDLLDPSDRELFEDLAVFAAPFTLDSAAEVCDSDNVERLIDASLLVAEGGRLRMLETIRDCARGLLVASGRDTYARHAQWVVRQVDEFAPQLNTAAEEAAIRALSDLLPEIRAATEYLTETGVDLAADILVRTRRVWFVQGLLGEIRERLDRVAPLLTSPRTKIEVAAMQAIFARVTGDPAARGLLERVLPPLRATPEADEILINTLCQLAVLECEAGEADPSTAHAAEAVRVARGLGGPMLEMALDLSSFVARTVGDLDLAIAVAREAVEAGRSAPSLQLASALATFAHTLADAGHHDEAAEAGLEALARVRSEFPIVRNEIVGEVATALGKQAPSSVVAALGEAISFAVVVGAWPMAVHTICALNVIAAGTHDRALAQLIAAVSRHQADPKLDAFSADLRQRLGADAWLDASSVGASLSADDLARVVQDCTAGFST